MAYRPEILELVQVGVEVTPGTAVAANKRLQSLSVDLDPKIPTEVDRAQGFKSPSGVIVMKEHTEASFKGNASINDLAYIFATLLCTPVVTTPEGATNSRLFTFFPDVDGADAFKSLTLEKGSGSVASKVTNVRADELELTFVPDKGVDMKGKLIGQEIQDGITMTASPTLIERQALSPRNISIKLGVDEESLAAIKPLEAKWSIKNRHTPVFTLDDSEPSFDEHVEKGLSVMGQITVPQGSTANGYMTDLRAGTTKFAQIRCRGPVIESTFYNELLITFPFQFREPKRNAKNDVHCGVYDLESVYDETFGGSIKVEITTEMTAL